MIELIAANAYEIFGGILLVLALALAAVKSKAIDVPGALAGAFISFAAFLAGGVAWLLIIVAFFGISSLLTRFKYDYKRSLGSAQEKGGKRSWPNAVANGAVSAVVAIAEIFTHQEIFIVAFLGSVAAAMGDTVATEIGLLSKSKPRSITNLKKFVAPGTSGGVSLLGELAALGSALGIAVIGLYIGILGGIAFKDILSGVLAIVVGAFLATNLDSLIGERAQGLNKCQICGALTENRTHCGREAIPVKGVRALDNNGVNLIATIAAAILSIALFLLFVRTIP